MGNSKKWTIAIFSILLILIVFRKDLIFQPYHYYLSQSAQIETLEINISKSNFKTLENLRIDVLKKQKAKAHHKIYVKAGIVNKNDTFKVKIRLKGDQIDHYQTTPPSYRVKVKGGQKILGTNKFSLQNFGARNFLTEWTFLKLLEQQDVLSLKSDIVEININNKKSICTFEEHFTHFLTDRFERPPGPIICISEDIFWKDGQLNDYVKYISQQEIYLKSPLKEFKYYAPLDSTIVEIAKNLLNDFRKKKKEADEVFDIDKLAIHLAISDLTNTHHGLRWHNRRYYYNPVSKKLEPIGFDGSSWKPTYEFAYDNEELKSLKWCNLFSNKAFVKAYLFQLERMSKVEFLNQFYDQYDNEITQLEKKIYKKNLFYSNDYELLYINASWIRENLVEYQKRLCNQLL
jgi:hypothetical protein